MFVGVDTFFNRANQVKHFKWKIQNIRSFINPQIQTSLHFLLNRKILCYNREQNICINGSNNGSNKNSSNIITLTNLIKFDN
jgi:hypothetical protein